MRSTAKLVGPYVEDEDSGHGRYAQGVPKRAFAGRVHPSLETRYGASAYAAAVFGRSSPLAEKFG